MFSELIPADGRGFAVDQRHGKQEQKRMKRAAQKPRQAHRRGEPLDWPVRYALDGKLYGPLEFASMMQLLTGPMPTEPIVPLPWLAAKPAEEAKHSKSPKPAKPTTHRTRGQKRRAK